MVERLLCKQDVSGSNPLTSTRNATDKNRKENRFSTVIIASEQEDEDAGVLDSSSGTTPRRRKAQGNAYQDRTLKTA